MFDDMKDKMYHLDFSGMEIVALFNMLESKENNLDSFEMSSMEKLRTILYQHLKINEMQNLSQIYSFQVKDSTK